jgi:hypothetical protein
MIKYENECCDCATPAYPCIGELCPNRRVPHYYCDECRSECDGEYEHLYEYYGEELCLDCIEKRLTKVK